MSSSETPKLNKTHFRNPQDLAKTTSKPLKTTQLHTNYRQASEHHKYPREVLYLGPNPHIFMAKNIPRNQLSPLGKNPIFSYQEKGFRKILQRVVRFQASLQKTSKLFLSFLQPPYIKHSTNPWNVKSICRRKSRKDLSKCSFFFSSSNHFLQKYCLKPKNNEKQEKGKILNCTSVKQDSYLS